MVKLLARRQGAVFANGGLIRKLEDRTSRQQCDVHHREIRKVKGTHYRMVLRIS